ncbi:MAG: hypothetical protein IH855_11975 [Bacteroidetes bacterium]|nr:hypothetical protein [Bacteroidota bacterium]
MLSKRTLLLVEGTHTLSKGVALFLREGAETVVLCSLRASVAATELAGSPSVSTCLASLSHGSPPVAHGPVLVAPRLALKPLSAVHLATPMAKTLIVVFTLGAWLRGFSLLSGGPRSSGCQ